MVQLPEKEAFVHIPHTRGLKRYPLLHLFLIRWFSCTHHGLFSAPRVIVAEITQVGPPFGIRQ